MRGYGSVTTKNAIATWCVLMLACCTTVWAQQQKISHEAIHHTEKNVADSSSVVFYAETDASDVAAVREEVSAGIIAVLTNNTNGSETAASGFGNNRHEETGLDIQREHPKDSEVRSSPTPEQNDVSEVQAGFSPDQGDELKLAERPSAQRATGSGPKILRSNCGPILLKNLFATYGINATVGELIEQSNTRFGVTTLSDMKRTVIERGLFAEGIKTDFATLVELIKSYDVICHFTENNHYILIKAIDGKKVRFIDPSWVPMEGEYQSMWRHVFEKEWKGICLVVSKKPLEL